MGDKAAALSLLRRATALAAARGGGRQLQNLEPLDDFGIAAVYGKRGVDVLTQGSCGHEEELVAGLFDAMAAFRAASGQVASETMFHEMPVLSNVPMQVEVMSANSCANSEDASSRVMELMFTKTRAEAANAFSLFQMTKAVLNDRRFEEFVREKLGPILHAVPDPPHKLAIVVGGLSAEQSMKICKLASIGYMDALPRNGSEGGRAFRDEQWEARIRQICHEIFEPMTGQACFIAEVRVVRLPRHGASCPVSVGVSPGSNEKLFGRIDASGVFLEQVEEEPGRFLP